MMLKTFCIAAFFVALRYSVRISRERNFNGTIKAYLHIGYGGTEPVTIGINSKTAVAPQHYDLLCDADRTYTKTAHVLQGALHKLEAA